MTNKHPKTNPTNHCITMLQHCFNKTLCFSHNNSLFKRGLRSASLGSATFDHCNHWQNDERKHINAPMSRGLHFVGYTIPESWKNNTISGRALREGVILKAQTQLPPVAEYPGRGTYDSKRWWPTNKNQLPEIYSASNGGDLRGTLQHWLL